MAEYIDKHEAYLLLKDLEAAYIYPPVKEAYATAARRIDQMEPADARPVIHAYWIRGKEYGFRTNNSMWYCSNCGGSIRYNTTLGTYQKHKKPVEEVNPFCRKCGAIMDRSVIFAR